MINFHHFEMLFKAAPEPLLVLKPDSPYFTIAEVNDSYCKLTDSSRKDLLEKRFFEAIPENTSDLRSNARENLERSLQQVITTRTEHLMPVQQYDIPFSGTNGYQVKYWSVKNCPVLDENGELMYILHAVTDVTEQVITENKEKAARLELLQNQEHYRSLFDNNPDAVFSMDLNGFFMSANEALAQMMECPFEELLKQTFEPFVGKRDAARVFQHFQKAVKGEAQNYNTEAYTAKGNRLIVNVTNLPITVNEEIVGVYGISKDITKRVLADDELRQQKQQFNKIMHSSRDVICIIDENRNFVKVSAAAERLWGYRPDELEGRPYMDLIQEKGADEMAKTAEELKRKAFVEKIENQYRHKDGRIVTMSWSAFWDETERLSYCVGRDITDEKSAAEKIRNNEKRFKTLLQNSTDGLMLVNADGIILEISETGSKIFGYPSREIIGHSRADLVHPDDLEHIRQAFNDILSNRNLNKSFEYRLKTPDGDYKWIEANFQNQLDEPAVGALVMNFRDITESKTASEKLRSSEDRYRHLFEYNPMPMWVYDISTGRFLEVNQAAIKKYGYSKEEFLEMTIADIRPEEDLELLKKAVSTSYGLRYNGMWRHLKKNKELMYVDITGHTIEYNGRPASLVLAMDFTEKVLAEEARRKSEEVRTMIMNSALDAIVCMDTDGKVTLWNDQAERIFGWNREELLGKRLFEYIIPAAFRNEHETALKEFFLTGQWRLINKVSEVTAINKKGIEIPIELTIVHIKQDENDLFCAFMRDITERKNHLTALDRSEKRYKTLVQEGSDLINILDESGHFVYVSPTYLSQLGYTADQLMAQNVFDLIHEDDRSAVLEAFERLKSEKRARSLPFRFKDGNGEYRWLESVGTNLSSDPSINGLVINSKDITERMNYIQAIENQNRKLRDIAWTQSHVFRAPLSRIMGIVDVLTNYPEVDSKKLLESLGSSTQELDELIRSIVKSTEQIEK
jgi:PAS domain S-box-containing protein